VYRVMNKFKSTVTGFTLIELMIVVAIVAILASIAVPSYRQYVIRSNRSAAQSVMMDIANRQQQFLLANRTYADDETLLANGYTLPAEVSANYTLDINADPPLSGPPVFTISLTPLAGSGQASDVTLTLDQQGVKTPADKWRR
jgi:type IV pilus assembly protein PilE